MDPLDLWSIDEAVAVLVTGPEGADTLRAAVGGADLRTPAFRSEAGPVLLFRPSIRSVRTDLPGVAVLNGDDLPELVEWIGGSERLPLAEVPRALLEEPGEATEPEQDAPSADELDAGEMEAAKLDVDNDEPAIKQEGISNPVSSHFGTKVDHAPASQAHCVRPASAVVVTVDAPIMWGIVHDQLELLQAPPDPRAVPSERQREAVAILLQIRNGDQPVSMSEWRAACRSAWGMSASSARVSFRRVIETLAQRGAIQIEGEQAVVVGRTDPCHAPNSALLRPAAGVTEPCSPRNTGLFGRVMRLLRLG